MPYRDHEALRARRDALSKRLQELQAQTRDLGALREEEARVRSELDATRALLDGVGPRMRLPMLDAISIASPCSASWDDMVGDERARFCGKCEKNVYNLSSLTRAEAEALLVEKEGKVCVRYYQRADGTVLTA